MNHLQQQKSPCILTSNPPPPEDPGFQRRIIPIHYSKDDAPSAEEIEAFNIFLKDNIDKLGTLGDFAANYVLKNQEIITKDDWKSMAVEILTEFFKTAGKEVPTWINDFVDESQVQDIAEEQEQTVRGFLIKVVNDTHSRNYMSLASSTDREHPNTDFKSRLDFCLDKDLVSFLKRKKDTDEILIMHDIVKEMKAYRINHVSTLAELGRMFQCEVKPAKIGNKTVRPVIMPKQKFIEFITPSLSS
jgi:hypothetical protein